MLKKGIDYIATKIGRMRNEKFPACIEFLMYDFAVFFFNPFDIEPCIYKNPKTQID